MKTDDLIDALSRDLEPAKPVNLKRMIAAAGVIGLVGAGLLLVATVGGVRPDFGANLPVVLAKAMFGGVLAAATLPVLFSVLRPGVSLGRRALVVAGLLALSVVVGLVAVAGDTSGDRLQAWTGGGFPWCVVFIPLLATPAAVGLTWLARDLAPTRLPLAGAAIGALAGSVGAMVYAMYCPVDSVAFVTTWYAVAIALCAAIGAIVGARFLRW